MRQVPFQLNCWKFLRRACLWHSTILYGHEHSVLSTPASESFNMDTRSILWVGVLELWEGQTHTDGRTDGRTDKQEAVQLYRALLASASGVFLGSILRIIHYVIGYRPQGFKT